MNLQLLEQMNKGIPAILNLSETGKEVKMELQKIGGYECPLCKETYEDERSFWKKSFFPCE